MSSLSGNRFFLFFLLKGLRPDVWKAQDINIGEKNPSNINFASMEIRFVSSIQLNIFSKVWGL